MNCKLIIASILTVILTGCGVISATQSMPGKMDDTFAQIQRTNEQMQKTNEIVRQQPVQISFEDMLKPELGQDLVPIPFDLMPFAEKFGQYATADEVIKVVYLWMKKLNELQLEVDTPSADQVAAFNHHKLQIFSALQAVCGLLPEDKVREILATEVEGDGRFQVAALQLAMLRVRFLRDVMLEASLFAEPLDNVGKLEKATEYAQSIDILARLPYAREIKVKVTGFLEPYPQVAETFDPGLALATWTKVKAKAERSLVVAPKDWTGDAKVNQKLFVERQVRYDQALSLINRQIKSWGAKP